MNDGNNDLKGVEITTHGAGSTCVYTVLKESKSKLEVNETCNNLPAWVKDAARAQVGPTWLFVEEKGEM